MSNLPTEPGLYLCLYRPEDGATEYNCVLVVEGKAPFLRARSLGLNSDGINGEISKVKDNCFTFGPKIDTAIRQ